MKITEIPTPAYVLDKAKLIQNLELLRQVQQKAGCKILLAQKAFSMYYVYPLIGKYLAGTTASSLFEAKLGKEEMGKENHIFSPAYKASEIDEIADICDHVIFNSFSQFKKYRKNCEGKTSIGLRINPECSTQEHSIYNPCAPYSRLGITYENFVQAWKEEPSILDHVDGFHFHTLCEQNLDALETTLQSVVDKFGKYFKQIKWLNMGGGHHITRADYDVEGLIRCIGHFKEKYGLEVYLEPGEAIALNAGFLAAEVLDVVDNGVKTAILDVSAACHMPDVLEMPYRPPLKDSAAPQIKAYTYRLASCTCLAGDVIGDYSFDHKLVPGERLYFEDMAIYSMVKNNTFNGIGLPAIAIMEPDGECHIVKSFGYQDFKNRLS